MRLPGEIRGGAEAGTGEGKARAKLVAAWRRRARSKCASPRQPVDDRANDALRKLLARTLKVSVSAVKILSGEKSRTKRVADRRSDNRASAGQVLAGRENRQLRG